MSVTGIVLAGGRATRFGGPKLSADLEGTTILGRAIDAVSSVVDGIILAGPSLPETPAQIGREAGSIAVIPDEQLFGGPLAALAGALDLTRDGVALVVGGDMPRLVPEVLRSMVARLVAATAVDAVLLGRAGLVESEDVTVNTRRQVLPLAVRVEPARAAARDALAGGDRSLRAMLDRLSCELLPASIWLGLDPTAATLLDVDTRADLDRLRATRIGGDRA